jgi:hypothetical protein
MAIKSDGTRLRQGVTNQVDNEEVGQLGDHNKLLVVVRQPQEFQMRVRALDARER